jgi:hypothetical protein
MKKVIFLLIFPLIAEVVISCCNCIDPVVQHYTNKTISASNLDNTGKEPVVSTANSINKNAYGFRLQLTREKLACLEKRYSFFIQSYAMSCHCPPPTQFMAKDSITSIKVFTIQDFDGTHPAGVDVSDYFKVYRQFAFFSISDFLTISQRTLYDERELQPQTDFLLMTAPTITGARRFKIQFTLSDGRILETETSTIDLI